MEPQKPFACTLADCGMTFTNEDHLQCHTKKHDMVLQLGMEQKSAFVADQTPTPTRFIRNCEEVGLFQDLQNVNPFDEGFKRAVEAKHGILALDSLHGSDDVLHTPQLHVFPDTDATVYTNTQRNITISRSSSDESGTLREYETRKISQLTNEVTISRVVGKTDLEKDKTITRPICTNNVKIQTNVRKEDTYIDLCKTKDDLLQDKNPILSQKSIELAVENLTNEICNEKALDKSIDDKTTNNEKPQEINATAKDKETNNIEVIIKLPNGKQMRMKSAEEIKEEKEPKGKLREILESKLMPHITSIGTLIPVTLVNPVNGKVPIPKFELAPKRKATTVTQRSKVQRKPSEKDVNVKEMSEKVARMERHKEASVRYRARVRDTMRIQADENRRLKEANRRLLAERALMRSLVVEHMKLCSMRGHLKNAYEQIVNGNQGVG